MLVAAFFCLLTLSTQLGVGGYAGYAAFVWGAALFGGGVFGAVLGAFCALVTYSIVGLVAAYMVGWLCVILATVLGYSHVSFTVSWPLGARFKLT